MAGVMMGRGTPSSLSEAMLGSLGHVVHAAALDFVKWAPSAGILLLLATVLAVALSNSPLGPGFNAFWDLPLGFTFGGTGFDLSLRHWINDGLLVIFFLVVGLEIKREFTVGHLASGSSMMLPIAAAVGGMAVPALLYLILVRPGPRAQERMVDGLGRADGDRHRVCGRADRHDGQTRSDRTARIS